MARSCSRTTSHLLLIVAFACVAICDVRLSRGAHLPVYGSPPFTPGVGGYVGSYMEDPIDAAAENRIVVNDNGIAIGTLSRRDASRHELDIRAVRWSSTEAAELGNLGTDAQGIAYSAAFDINNAGTAVGGAVVGSNYISGTRPVRWSVESATATELDRLGSNWGSWAQAINEAGDAVGFYSVSNPIFTRAALWNAAGTAATPLSNPSGFHISEATGINDAGTIIGRATTLSDRTTYAVRWDLSGNATVLENLGPHIPRSSTAIPTVVNDAGVIAGSSSKHDSSGNTLGAFAVRWEALSTTATELQNPWIHPTTGQSEAHATAINAAGTIVGYAERYPGYGPAALRWDPGSTSAVILDNLGISSTGAYISAANAINADGKIVGFADKHGPDGNSMGLRAVYWRADDTVVDLNTLIDPNSGWSLTNATSISDTGWIAGYGDFDPDGAGGQQAYPRLFLIHVPEPPSLLLISIAILSGCMARQQKSRTAVHKHHRLP